MRRDHADRCGPGSVGSPVRSRAGADRPGAARRRPGAAGTQAIAAGPFVAAADFMGRRRGKPLGRLGVAWRASRPRHARIPGKPGAASLDGPGIRHRKAGRRDLPRGAAGGAERRSGDRPLRAARPADHRARTFGATCATGSADGRGGRVERPSCCRISPAPVRDIPRRLRSSSAPPRRRSSCWIARDSGGWAMPRRSAARPKCSSSATTVDFLVQSVNPCELREGERSGLEALRPCELLRTRCSVIPEWTGMGDPVVQVRTTGDVRRVTRVEGRWGR